MLVVGLTGGIGAGKSTFAALLAERGAQIIDADLIGRDAILPGRPAWHSVVAQFGEEIIVPGTMDVDRRRLADIVFADRRKLAALNAIVHPVIFKKVAEEVELLAGTDEVVIIDAALIVEAGVEKDVDVLVVVVSREELRIERLVTGRGMSRREVGARIRSQVSDADLIARADIVVTNDGSLEDLVKEADRVWPLLTALRDAKR